MLSDLLLSRSCSKHFENSRQISNINLRRESSIKKRIIVRPWKTQRVDSWKRKKRKRRKIKRKKEEKLLISNRDIRKERSLEERKTLQPVWNERWNWDLARTCLAGLWPRMWVTISCGKRERETTPPSPFSKDLMIRFTMEILARGEAFRKDFLACSLWILSREITNDGQSCETGIPSPSCFKNLLFFRTERERERRKECLS